MDYGTLALYLVLACAGFSAQILQKLVEIRRTLDSSMSLLIYIKRWPYATTLALMGSLAGITLLLAGDQATASTAFMAGYAGNAAFDHARTRKEAEL